MTNQKTPVQGGVTEEQIEALAVAKYPFRHHGSRGSWDAPEECACEDCIITSGKQYAYEEGYADALSASASAHPAGEHHDAEERERVCGHWWDVPASPYYETAGLFTCALPLAHGGPHVDAKDGVRWHGDPSSVGTCGAPSEREAESEDHAATVTGDRPVTVIMDEVRAVRSISPCARGLHRWAWLTGGGQACGICGALRGEGRC